MFKVNDYVVYGSRGVCQIIDIIKEKHLSTDETEYYVLQPAYDDKMTIKTPVKNPKVLMREIITKDDVSSLISTIPEEETWIDDDRQRSENFKTALRTGKSEELMKIINTLQTARKEKSSAGKKLTNTDEDIMETAEKQLYEEFAIALNISPDEVGAYMLGHIS